MAKNIFTKTIEKAKEITHKNKPVIEKEMKDDNSVLHFYQKLIKIRKNVLCIREGNYLPVLNEDKDIAAYTRNIDGQGILVIANFHNGTKKISLPEYEVKKILASNYNRSDFDLKAVDIQPYEAIMLEI